MSYGEPVVVDGWYLPSYRSVRSSRWLPCAIAGRADERASCARSSGTTDSQKPVAHTLASQLGWVEVGGMTFRQAGFIVRTEQIATFTGVVERRLEPGHDHARVYRTRIDPLRTELDAGATIAVQLSPSADEEMYAVRTVALRDDGTVRWIGDCPVADEDAEFAAFVVDRVGRGDKRSAAEMFRALISKDPAA